MTVGELLDSNIFEIENRGDETCEITGIFCCDLLSTAMGCGKAGSAWVTVIGNVNTLAVLRLTDMACIILAEGTRLDEEAMAKAKEMSFTVLRSEEPVFESALKVYDWLESR